LLFILSFASLNAETISGSINSDEQWNLVSSYCLQTTSPKYGPAIVNWTIWIVGNNNMLVTYYDDIWESVYNNTALNCSAKILKATDKGIFPIQNGVSNATSITDTKARRWYFVIANCDAQNIKASYQFTFTQPKNATGDCSVDNSTTAPSTGNSTAPSAENSTAPSTGNSTDAPSTGNSTAPSTGNSTDAPGPSRLPTNSPTHKAPTVAPTARPKNITRTCRTEMTKFAQDPQLADAEDIYKLGIQSCIEEKIGDISELNPGRYQYNCFQNTTKYSTRCHDLNGKYCQQQLQATKKIDKDQIRVTLATYKCIPQSCSDDSNMEVIQLNVAKSAECFNGTTCVVWYECGEANNSPAIWITIVAVAIVAIGCGAFFIWWKKRPEEPEYI